MTTMLKDCPDTKQSKFKRVRPFNGMMLSEEDYRLEQAYFREKIKLHNRLHGYGVVCGLQIEKIEVTTEELAQNSDKAYSIRLHSGMAIDWNGQEIIVCEDRDVNLRKCISDIALKKSGKCQGSTDPIKMVVGIKYDERPGEPQAIFAPHCGNGEKTVEFSRTCESYKVHAFSTDDTPWQPEMEQSGWTCPLRTEREHYILLGRLTFDKANKKIESVEDSPQYFPPYRQLFRGSAPENQFIPKAMLKETAESMGWIDIGFVVNKNLEDAKAKLNGFSDVTSVDLSAKPDVLRYLFKHATEYFPFAKNDDKILLIHTSGASDKEKIVLFPIVAPDEEIKKLAA